MTYKVFYIPSFCPEAIDLSYDNGKTGIQSGATFEQLREQYTGLQIADRDAFEALRESSLRLPVSEIDEATFNDQLEVLPPDDLVIVGQQVSFKCSERYSGRITSIYAGQGPRYFHLRDVCDMPHAEIMRRVEQFMSSTAAQAEKEAM